MFPCPECGSDSRVTDSRYAADVCRRRRECHRCKHRWSTYETIIDPRKLMTMGNALRSAFSIQSRKVATASITEAEQAKLDARAERTDTAERRQQIVKMSEKKLTTSQIAGRLRVPVRYVRDTLYGSRK